MSGKHEALRLAEILEGGSHQFNDEVAAELRRLQAFNVELLEALKDVVPHLEYMAGGMTHAAWKTKEAQECLERTKYAIAKATGGEPCQ